MLEQGVVQELHKERSSARGLVGNICLGRVARVLPGMQSAFVEIGLEKNGFLHVDEVVATWLTVSGLRTRSAKAAWMVSKRGRCPKRHDRQSR